MGAVQDHFNADGFKGYDDGQKMMNRIKALPSAEAKHGHGDGQWFDLTDALTVKRDKWIPCSEMLPQPKDETQRRGWYLTTNEHKSVGITCYEFYGIKSKGWRSDFEILAWMPLPMPYREDGKEYDLATEQMEHDALYEPTYSSEDGGM